MKMDPGNDWNSPKHSSVTLTNARPVQSMKNTKERAKTAKKRAFFNSHAQEEAPKKKIQFHIVRC